MGTCSIASGNYIEFKGERQMSFWKILGTILAAGATNAQAKNGSMNSSSTEENEASIEYLTVGGSWFPVGLSSADSFSVNIAMQNAKRQYPDSRIRAVTRNGRLLDMM